MNPRIAANQLRTFLDLLGQVQPHLQSDSALPRRIKELIGRNRALGSRDRRLYRELLYTAIRFLPWISPLLTRDPEIAGRAVAILAPELPETTGYRAALLEGLGADGNDATLSRKAAHLQSIWGGDYSLSDLLPSWLHAECPAAFESPHLEALNTRANLWIRLQTTDHSLVLNEFTARGWAYRIMPDFPDAVCLPPNADFARTDALRRGFCEIQDLGSQLVLRQVSPDPGSIWLDACAGAGGKSLQLAQMIGPTGRVDATDIRPEALTELQERATRGRFSNIRILPKVRADDLYDGVLVDAPCSGTGTWRRLPHMKWYTQPAMLDAFANTQLGILSKAAHQVRSGGLLVYATCSLTRRENHDVVSAFLVLHQDFEVEASRLAAGISDGLGSTLLPGTLDTDGFYVALLRRNASA